jgi:hypothetical protein
MLVFSMSDLRLLARVYSVATGLELTTLGYRCANNWKLFTRLDAGLGCSAKGAEAATAWFIEHWPNVLPWPDGVPDLRWRKRISSAA